MILYLTGFFLFWTAAVAVIMTWYGILVLIGVVTLILAGVLTGIAFVLIYAQGIFSERRREGRFG